MGWRWPWQAETRAEQGGAYTNALVALLRAQAAAVSVAVSEASSGVETAAGLVSRAFQAAELAGVPDYAADALSPACLGLVGRALVRSGECVLAIDVSDGRVRLSPALSWNVAGSPDPARWVYHVTEAAPSAIQSRYLPSASVLHFRLMTDPETPWRGVSPAKSAPLAGRLLSAIEGALGDEASGPRGNLLPVPAHPEPDDDDETADPLAPLRAEIAKLAGRTALVEDQAERFGTGGPSPGPGWKAQRLGAAPPAALVELYGKATGAVLATHGIPAALFSEGDATAKRESWRQVLHGVIAPIGMVVQQELREKLDAPDLALGWAELRASDIAGRARGFASMVNGGMDLARAAALAGLLSEDVE